MKANKDKPVIKGSCKLDYKGAMIKEWFKDIKFIEDTDYTAKELKMPERSNVYYDEFVRVNAKS